MVVQTVELKPLTMLDLNFVTIAGFVPVGLVTTQLLPSHGESSDSPWWPDGRSLKIYVQVCLIKARLALKFSKKQGQC